MSLIKRMLFVAIVSVAAFVQAATEIVDGIEWTYTVTGGKASVGGGYSSSTAVPTSMSGAIIIPSILGGYSVTSIGNYAFNNCDSLTSVTIPDSVTSIGVGAFDSCSSLKSVTIPDSVTSIGRWAFGDCSSLTSVTIPDGVTSIGDSAFRDCSSLTRVAMPDSITNIGYMAFSDCRSLTSVTIPDGVTSIGTWAFHGNSSLTSVKIPDSVTSIGSSAFGGCNSIRSVTISSCITNIESGVFSGCSSLTSVTIPDSVTDIGSSAFSGCSSLTSVTISECVRSIGGSAFRGCSSLTSITIPNSVTSIGSSAFNKCSSLISVTIPNGVTSIASSMFSECGSLTSITIPGSVTNIGESAFLRCDSLEDVHISDIASWCGIRFNSSYPRYENPLYYAKNLYLLGKKVVDLVIPEGVANISSNAFFGCSSLVSVTIPDSVTSIESGAFRDCSSLKKVYISDIVKWCNINFEDSVANPLYYKGELYLSGVKLVNLVIPNEVANINSFAFMGCSSLTNVTIQNSVTNIGQQAFDYCIALESVVIPESVMNIGASAFYESKNKKVYIDDIAKWCAIRFATSNANPLNDTNGGGELYLSGTKLVDLVIPDNVTNINSYAFYGYHSLRSVTIPDSVLAIGDSAFSWCRSLSRVTIGQSVRSIGSSAFSGNSLSSIDIPDCVNNIGRGAFADNSLHEVTIGCGVTNIGSVAFKGNSISRFVIDDKNGFYKVIDGLLLSKDGTKLVTCLVDGKRDVMIPNSVTDIGEYAFYHYGSLTSVTIPDSVTSIGENAFYYCMSLANVAIGDGVTSIGGWAFGYCGSLTDIVFYGDAPESMGYAPFEWHASSCSVYVKPGSTGWDVDIPGKWMGINIDYFRYSDVLCGEWSDGIVGEAEVNAIEDITTESGMSVKFTADDSSSVWIETEVTNACRVTFKWKSSCEPLVKGSPYDYFSFEVDGVQKGFICGETPWTEYTIEIAGDGVHRLKWCFQRDDEGDGGDNCAWLADLDIAYVRAVRFDSGGASEGAVPEQMLLYEGSSITIPDQGSLLCPKHTFAGWCDGLYFSPWEKYLIYQPGASYTIVKDVVFTAQWNPNELKPPVISGPETFEADSCTVSISAEEGSLIHYTLDGTDPTPESPLYVSPLTIERTTVIKAVAFKDNYFDSGVAALTVTRGVWTFGEYLNWPEQELTTSGDAEWIREKGVSEDGYALRSGDITHSQESKLETVVYGQGKISFKCRVEGEIVKKKVWDGLTFCIDGVQQGDLIGDSDWVEKTYTVTGSGAHTLSWIYQKDEEGDGSGEDCAWLDEVVWMPTLPELSDSATTNDVAKALRGAVDAKLTENIKTATEYSAFRSWALGLSGATLDDVNDSPNAWLSYALNTEKLIEGEVTESQLNVSIFEQLGENGLFSIKLKLNGIDIGDAATVKNLLKVFAIEGAKELSDDSFSVNNVALDVVQPIDGEVEFVVTPRKKNTGFFFRVRMRDNVNGVGENFLSKVQLWEGGPYWATMNIGAEKPEDYGYYFWWGDTVGYKRENSKWVASDGLNYDFSFDEDNVPTYNKSISTLLSQGWIISKNGTYVLASEYDAAQKHWGGDWRMPTYQEFKDLNNKCDWIWSSLNGVNGYIVHGRGSYASNSIFLPCAGDGNGTSLNDAGSYGDFWSSVPGSDYNYYSWYLHFGSGGHGMYGYYRYIGKSVRPVQGFTK